MVSLIKFSVSTAVKYINMGKYFYAVHRGWNTGIFDTWAECQVNVKKFPNARFKKFATIEEAQNFADSGSSCVGDSQSVGHHPKGNVENTAGSSSFSKSCQQHAWSKQDGDEVGAGSSRKRKGASYSTGSKRSRVPPKRSTSTSAESYQHHDWGEQVNDEVEAKCSRSFKGAAFPTRSKRSKVAHVPKRSASSAAGSSHPPVEVYTDGACTHNGRRGARAGIGVHWNDSSYTNISERLTGKQTNQRAELNAAIRAVEEAGKRGVQRLKLHTDSKYTINCVTDWNQRWKTNGWKTATGKDVINKEDIVQLDSLCEKVNVEWVYVPGHSNIPGNEAADQLAREGAGKSL